MSLYQFRPLPQPFKTKYRPGSPFFAEYTDTEILLEREIRHLNARNVVLQADCLPSEIRLDGTLKANARLRSPGVILSFDSKHGPLSYPCDKFNNWQSNVRAIALALEALRKVERYGVTKRGEQYRGWEQLPEPDPTAIILKYAPHSANDIKNAVREAKKKTHPDAGGTHEDFIAVCNAAESLGL
jgi:hypothetical protein